MISTTLIFHSFIMLIFIGQPHIHRLLECSNDVERNPGPSKGSKTQIISKLRSKSGTTKGKKEAPVNHPLEMDANGIQSLLEEHSHALREQRAEIEALKRKQDSQNSMTLDFAAELSEIRRNWQSLNAANESNREVHELSAKVDSLSALLNDIQDRLYELDKSWKNNLVLFGVPGAEEDEDTLATLEKVREVLQKKLYISRDIPMSRISRINYGPDFRGHKPILLCLVNYRDKEELLRKSRLLKGTNIYLSEDYSRKVREHRHELIKFMKEVRTRDPAKRMNLRYDKLYMGHDVFFFNDRTNRVERMQTNIENAGNATFTASLGNLIINDSQNSLQHEVNWMRRPRSRAASRCTTPLSTSMEDYSDNLPPISYSTRVPSSARSRQSSPTKVPYSGPSPYPPKQEQQPSEVISKKPSVSNNKSVGFKNIPCVDKETPRMLNGTPHHNPFPRNSGNSNKGVLEDEEVLTVVKDEGENVVIERSSQVVAEKKKTGPPPPVLLKEEEEQPPMELVPYNNNNAKEAEEEAVSIKILPPISSIESGILSSMDIKSNEGFNGTIFPDIHSNATKVLSFEAPGQQNGGSNGSMVVPFSKYESNNANNNTGLCICKSGGPSSNKACATFKQIEFMSGRNTNGKLKSNCTCSGDSGVIKLAMFGEFSMSNIQQRNTSCSFSNSN